MNLQNPDEIKKTLEKGIDNCINAENCRENCAYEKECSGICSAFMVGLPRALIEDALDYIKQLESRVHRWISVEERLPEEGELVLFIPTINQGSVYVGKLSHTGARGGVLFENRQGRTTMKYYAKYWMPLPEPPEVNEK